MSALSHAPPAQYPFQGFLRHKADVIPCRPCVNAAVDGRTITRTFVLAVAIGSMAAGCAHVGDTARQKPSWLDRSAAPPDAAELRYLVDRDTGRVFMEVPPPVLANVRVQLLTTGHEEVAHQIGRLYDLQTGRVRDPEHAKAAELRIRGPNPPPLVQPVPESPPPGASSTPPRPPELPASSNGGLPGTTQRSGGSRPGIGRIE